MSDAYDKLLAEIREGYARIQAGELGTEVWHREGASSYTTIMPAQKREAKMAENDSRSVEAKLYKQLSDARSHLGRALLECQRAHERATAAFAGMSRPSDATDCVCDGCKVRKSIELALGDLEP